MRKRLITLTIVDIVLIAIWAFLLNTIKVSQGASMAFILIVPVLILLSGAWGLALKWAKYEWANPMLINVVIALTIFFIVFKNEVERHERNEHRDFYFVSNAIQYHLIINLHDGQPQNGLLYYFYERTGEYGNGATGFDGHYVNVNDTLFLTSNSGRAMKIYEDNLLGYTDAGDTIRMKTVPVKNQH